MSFLLAASRPRTAFWAQALLAGNLLCGAYYVLTAPLLEVTGPREGFLTVLGSIVPMGLWTNFEVARVIRVLFLCLALPWYLRLGGPLVRWGCVLAFWCASSICIEATTYTEHEPNVIAVTLFLLAIPSDFNRTRPWRRHDLLRLNDHVAPRWLYEAVLAYTVSSYAWAGYSKLADSGLGWLDGRNLQLWIWRVGVHNPVSDYVMNHLFVANGMVATVLATECLCVLALLFRRTRVACGVVLAGFHVGGFLLFGYEFWGNVVLVLAVLVMAPLLEVKDANTLASADP